MFYIQSAVDSWTKLLPIYSMVSLPGTLVAIKDGSNYYLVGVISDATSIDSQGMVKSYKLDASTSSLSQGLCGKLLKTNRYVNYSMITSSSKAYLLSGTYSGTGYPIRNGEHFCYISNSNTHVLCG